MENLFFVQCSGYWEKVKGWIDTKWGFDCMKQFFKEAPALEIAWNQITEANIVRLSFHESRNIHQ